MAIISADGDMPAQIGTAQRTESILVDEQHRVILSPLSGLPSATQRLEANMILVDEEHRLIVSRSPIEEN